MSLYVTMFVWVTVHHNVCVCVATLPSVTMVQGQLQPHSKAIRPLPGYSVMY